MKKLILISIILIFGAIILETPTKCMDVILFHSLPEYQEQNLDVQILEGRYWNNTHILWKSQFLPVNFTAYQNEAHYKIYLHNQKDHVTYVVRTERTNWIYQIYIKRELK